MSENSYSVSIRKFVAEELGLKPQDVLRVDIKSVGDIVYDMVKVTKAGSTWTFKIQPLIIKHLNLKMGDPVSIEISDETGQNSLTEFTDFLKQTDITIRYFIADDLMSRRYVLDPLNR